MALHLVEVHLSTPDRSAAATEIERLAAAFGNAGVRLVEAQITADVTRAFVILEGDDCAGVDVRAGAGAGVENISEPVPVRLVGASLDDVAQRADADYLVEWDIPAEVTMDAYLARKESKAPLYAQIDDVAFLRTYVREDTQKCLCFYDAASEDAVRAAREVVDTPISRLHRLDDAKTIA